MPDVQCGLITWEGNDPKTIKITIFETEAEAKHAKQTLDHHAKVNSHIAPVLKHRRLMGRRKGSKNHIK